MSIAKTIAAAAASRINGTLLNVCAALVAAVSPLDPRTRVTSPEAPPATAATRPFHP